MQEIVNNIVFMLIRGSEIMGFRLKVDMMPHCGQVRHVLASAGTNGYDYTRLDPDGLARDRTTVVDAIMAMAHRIQSLLPLAQVSVAGMQPRVPAGCDHRGEWLELCLEG